ncbi:MAG: tRNA preQ1(34) S-adenosylmethionine ribosyltransferase-isomerase QueA, partial [Planctomycetes bacterium]|nr:tRNA preQ1(34) S-adenosylmethionine ribosyltransferase-isomerase QueA [Planctomycetota bacterium]
MPPERIAQWPAPERDASRLMVLGSHGTIEDRIFSDLPNLLTPGDILIRNNVRVLSARLRGRRRGGGAAELLLVRPAEKNGREAWLCLARPANRFQPGREFFFGGGELAATVLGAGEQGMVWMAFSRTGGDFSAALEQFGQLPLPPYIKRPDKRPGTKDAERYQTLYAKRPGAAAAPTAGLHFTTEVDRRLVEGGVELAELTLNVGPGTFRPIKTENLDHHRMDAEWYEIPVSTREAAERTRRRGGRVVAVGTTTARALETAALSGIDSGWSELFIRPGYRFRALDGLLTNFHLPGSSLLVMISALAGRERIL